MMLLPGFGSTRIPMQFRALLAVAISLTLLPLLYDLGAEAARQAGEPGRPLLLGGEILNGLTIGLLARLFMVALSFSATILTNIIGLAPTPGVPIDDTEPAPPLVNSHQPHGDDAGFCHQSSPRAYPRPDHLLWRA